MISGDGNHEMRGRREKVRHEMRFDTMRERESTMEDLVKDSEQMN